MRKRRGARRKLFDPSGRGRLKEGKEKKERKEIENNDASPDGVARYEYMVSS